MATTRPSVAGGGIMLGPLLLQHSPDEHAKNIFRLLNCLGIRCTDIGRITVNPIVGFAKVDLNSQECEDYAVNVLREVQSVMNLYDLRRLTEKPQNLVVKRIPPPPPSAPEKLKISSKDEGPKKSPVVSKTPTVTDAKPSDKVPTKTNAKPNNASKNARNMAVTKVKKSSAPKPKVKESVDKSMKSTTKVGKSSTTAGELKYNGGISKDTDVKPINANTVSQYKNTDGNPQIACKEHKNTTGEHPCKEVQSVNAGDDLKNSEGERRIAGEHPNNRGIISHTSKDEISSIEDPAPTSEKHDTTKTSTSTSSSLQMEFEELLEDSGSISVEHAATSTSDFVTYMTKAKQSIQGTTDEIATASQEKPIQIHVKTSTPFAYPCDCPETIFYHHLQHIGAETRHAEFKRGGIVFKQRVLRNVIGRYVCGFLNSEGGTLYLGVSDEGSVVGVEMDQEFQGTVRQDIEFAIRLVEPSVPECEYSVNFARVMDASGDLSPTLRVIEVCVKPRRPPHSRYSFNDIIFLRRDGSLQSLYKTKTAAGSSKCAVTSNETLS